jgi:hypothetical protein
VVRGKNLRLTHDLPRGHAQSSQNTNMIKSELVQRISDQNSLLYQRDVERLINAINMVTQQNSSGYANWERRLPSKRRRYRDLPRLDR